MRRFALGCMVAAMAWVGSAAAAEPDPAKELSAIVDSMVRSECDVPRIRAFLARRDFPTMNGRARSLAYTALGACDGASTHDAALKATAEPDALALAWSLRSADAVDRKDWPDAIVSIHSAVDRKADGTLNFFSDEAVYQVARGVRDDPEAFRKYAADLERGDWKPTDRYYGGDFIWAWYAGVLADAGDRAQAWRVASRVRDPSELLRMSLDKRFDAIVAVDPQRFDLVAAAEAEAKRVQSLSAANPREGMGVTYLVAQLRILGRQSEALALLDATLAQSGDIVDDHGANHRNWLINDRALVLMELGRFDEGVAAMEAAAGLRERGGVNVSQIINLAGLQTAAGHFEATLKTLATGDLGKPTNVSPYGRMWIAAERTCAEQALGHKAETARALAAATAEAKENGGAYAKAMLCVGDIDGLAGWFGGQLADPKTRSDALLQLSRYRKTPMTPFGVQMAARMETLRARPDIQAAVDAVGRMRDVPLQSGGLIDAY